MALEHIQTDGTETGLTASQKINLSFTEVDNNQANLGTKLNRNGDTMTGDLNIQSGDSQSVNFVRVDGSLGGGIAHSDTTDQVFISRYADDGITVESQILLGSQSVSISSAGGPPVIANPQDITTKEFVESEILVVQGMVDQNIINIQANLDSSTLNTTNIATNVTDIATNTSGIATNVTNIGALDTRVTALEGTSFNFSKSPQINDLDETTPQLIGTLSVPSIEAGTFMIGYSFAVDFGGVKDKSVHFRADINGSTGITYDLQSDKNSNHKNRYYAYPDNMPAGSFTLNFYMWKETGFTTQVDVLFCDLMLDKKV